MKGKIGMIIVLALTAMILIGCQPAKITANNTVQQDAPTSSSGAEPSSTGSQPAAQTSPSSSGASSTGSQPPVSDAKTSSSGASSTESQPDARSEFLSLMGKSPKVKVEFKTSGSATDETGTQQDFTGKMISYAMDGNGRTDLISDYDGESTETHFYDTATRKEACYDGQCTATTEDTAQDAAYNKAETVDGKPAAVTKLPGRTIAGIKASCYKVVVEQYFYYNSCFADDGTVLYNEVVDQKEGEQSTYIAEAISVTKDFPASVFEEK